MSELTHGSLFSGIGGFELGAQNAGIKTLWNCEIDDYKRKVLKKNFPTVKQYKDITKIKKIDYVDIISGGFPCQDISIANQSKKHEKGIKGKRSGLWGEMFRICRDVRPRFIIIENSTMLTIRGLERVLCDISKIGYNAQWQCLQAQQFGYKHKRERIFIIAYTGKERRKDYFKNSQKLQEILQQQSSRQITLPTAFERFNGKTIREDLFINAGFSRELDIKVIESAGDSVNVSIAEYLFNCIIN